MVQVRQCPSAALSVFRNDAADDGTVARPAEPTAVCRCGGSTNKPYCDGMHRTNGFRE